MSNNIITMIVGLIALFLTGLGISNKNKKECKENFLGNLPSMTWKIDRVMANSQQAAAKGDFFSVPGTYQAMLNPRFSNVDYGANIKYNMPSLSNQAVPSNPLTFSNMVKESYPSTCGGNSASVRVGAPMTEAGFAIGNYNEVLDSVYSGPSASASVSNLPVGDMSTLNAEGQMSQSIIYDRPMYANRNNRLRSRGDMIRGDLPIIPNASDWFQVSVHPNIDLQQGAMNVLGGIGNETSNKLSDLIYATSGNAQTAIGGVNMASQFAGSLGAGLNDIQITAYP